MTYLGTARLENGRVELPGSFHSAQRSTTYEAVDLGGDILLIASPLDRERLAQIEKIIADSIHANRKALEDLAK